MKSNKGFTLIELMIVVVILVILASVAIPPLTNLANGESTSQSAPIENTAGPNEAEDETW